MFYARVLTGESVNTVDRYNKNLPPKKNEVTFRDIPTMPCPISNNVINTEVKKGAKGKRESKIGNKKSLNNKQTST